MVIKIDVHLVDGHRRDFEAMLAVPPLRDRDATEIGTHLINGVAQLFARDIAPSLFTAGALDDLPATLAELAQERGPSDMLVLEISDPPSDPVH